jgi:sec-independent protein translocase protein TatB
VPGVVFGLGFWELIVIAVVALLFVGPDKLPEATRKISKGIRDFRRQTRELQKTLNEDHELGTAVRELKSALRGVGDEFDPIKPRPPRAGPSPTEPPSPPPTPEIPEPQPRTPPEPTSEEKDPVIAPAADAVARGSEAAESDKAHG